MIVHSRRATTLLGLAALAVGASAAASGDAVARQTARGHLFIVGGGSRPPALMGRFVELAGGPGEAVIVAIPLASASPIEAGQSVAEGLQSLGADVRVLIPTRAEADSPEAAQLLDGATGVWFNGGVQARVTQVLAGTPLANAIGRLYRDGGVVGGTSAGAAIMSDPMITGNQVRDTLGYYGDEFERIALDYIELTPGLGYITGVLIDQHFTVRERHNRLLSAVLSHPYRLGAGIDESTALIIRPDGRWEVFGESVVSVYDARQARLTDAGAPVLGASGVRLHVLPSGSVFDPRSGSVGLSSEPLEDGRSNRSTSGPLQVGARRGAPLVDPVVALR